MPLRKEDFIAHYGEREPRSDHGYTACAVEFPTGEIYFVGNNGQLVADEAEARHYWRFYSMVKDGRKWSDATGGRWWWVERFGQYHDHVGHLLFGLFVLFPIAVVDLVWWAVTDYFRKKQGRTPENGL